MISNTIEVNFPRLFPVTRNTPVTYCASYIMRQLNEIFCTQQQELIRYTFEKRLFSSFSDFYRIFHLHTWPRAQAHTLTRGPKLSKYGYSGVRGYVNGISHDMIYLIPCRGVLRTPQTPLNLKFMETLIFRFNFDAQNRKIEISK